MKILVAETRYEEDVKRSRFIVRAAPVASSAEALAFLERVRVVDATHNCWAYRIGAAYRFSDDGEPGGTAGRPILGAIEKQGLDQVMVVVIRYFGGIKLGAGGLARAYGGAVARCLRQAPCTVLVPRTLVRFEADFALSNHIYGLLKRLNAEKVAEQFTEHGVVLTVSLPADQRGELANALRDMSRGNITIRAVREPPLR